MKNILGLLVCLLLISGCDVSVHQRREAENTKQFFADSSITYVVLDANFKDAQSFSYYEAHYVHAPMQFNRTHSYTAVKTLLQTHDLLTIDAEQLDGLSSCEGRACQYIIAPLLSYTLIMTVDLHTAYEAGTVYFRLFATPSGFPVVDMKIVVIQIESPYAYKTVINPKDLQSMPWQNVVVE